MSNLREEFEKLPEISERVDDGWISFRNGIYWNKCLQHGDDYLNGAWYAFQEQQKRIDRLKNYLIVSCAFEDEYIEELLK